MKKLLRIYKDKLYTFLVLKNSAISAEYQSYVLADTERHAKHRIKSWIYLLKLNWKYRVRKLKLENKSIRKPYVGSESSISNRPLPIHLAMRLMKYDVISFDIFDTLILRNVANPHAVFDFVGERLGIQNFRNIRIKAEQDARTKKIESDNTREITIYDIYQELHDISIIDDIDKAVALELEIENDMCIANPYMQTIYNLLRDNGKKIYAVSDMYIPKKYLEKILVNNGYLYFEDILVSCDYDAGKYNTELFNVLKNKVATDSIIHIGDNYHSDIQSAMDVGIESIFYRGVNVYGTQYRTPHLSNPIKEAYAGIINNHLHLSNQSFSIYYEYGYIYGGLVLIGFSNYINMLISQYNIEKTLFIARDGALLTQIFNQYFPKINIDYLYFSRKIALKACAEENYYNYVQRSLSDAMPNRNNSNISATLNDFFITMDINISHHNLENYGLTKDDNICEENINTIKKMLYDNKNKILNDYKKYRVAFKEYLSVLIDNSKSLLLVDIGWAGITALQLKKFIQSNFSYVDNIEIVYSGFINNNDKFNNSILFYKNTIHNYLFSYNYNPNIARSFKYLEVILFEFLFSHIEPSALAILENSFYFSTPEIENKKIIKEIHQGMLDFYHNYYNAFKKYDYMFNVSGYDAAMTFLFLSQTDQLVMYANYFLNMALSASSFSSSSTYIKTLDDTINLSTYLSKLFKRAYV